MSRVFKELKIGYAIGILTKMYDSNNVEAPKECLNASAFYEDNELTKGNVFNLVKWMAGVNTLIKNSAQRAWNEARTTPIDTLKQNTILKLSKRMQKLNSGYYRNISDETFTIMGNRYASWINEIKRL